MHYGYGSKMGYGSTSATYCTVIVSTTLVGYSTNHEPTSDRREDD
jgi:hypothetical protein